MHVCILKGKKYFFKNRFEKFQTDFSNFETPSLAVSKFRNAQKKIVFKKFQNAQKKKHFQILQNDFFVFKVQNDFYSFSSRFQYENEKISFSPKFRFQNLIVFKCFKTIFSVFQPFSVCERKNFRFHQNFVFKI